MFGLKPFTFKRVILLTLFLFFLFNLTSCKKAKEYSDLKKTTYASILTEKGNNEHKYLVIVYSTTCSWCKNLEENVVDYYNRLHSLKNGCHNTLPKLYVLCVDNVINQAIKADNDDDYDNFVGTTNYEMIKVSAEPALIEVTNQQVSNLISSKTTTRPYTEIKNYLSNL